MISSSPFWPLTVSVRIRRVASIAMSAANVAELVEDIASQAVERLIGVTPDSGDVRKAIDAAVGGRS